ncbi:hypothetical protein T03_7296 [Trichinella britovi]|uniref:Uncharacterized protein n=1 Tax=Trichinella britovi TaxID=45882 RepID=A0A0V1AMA8_TRIBR|nr:hypothetical protein T03_7296 [Trichinella britovi]
MKYENGRRTKINIVFYEGNLLKQGRKNMDSRFPAQQFSICLC